MKSVSVPWKTLAAVLAVALLTGLALQRRSVAQAHEAELAALEQTLAALRAKSAALGQRSEAAGKAKEKWDRLRAETAKRRPEFFRGSSMPEVYTENPQLTQAAFLPLVRRRFAEILGSGGISPGQAQQVEATFARLGPLLEMYLRAGASELDSVGSDAAWLAAVVEPAHELFGAEVAARVEEVLRTRHLQGAMDDLAVRTHYADAPLDAAQSRRLKALLVESGAGLAAAGKPLRLTGLDWELVMQRAAGFLAPPQLHVLDGLRARAVFDREYERITGFPALSPLPEPER